jgi:plastocyanin
MTRMILPLALILGAGTAAAEQPTPVAIKLFMYQPTPLEVAAGTTVVWTNQDAIEHSVTPERPAGDFGSDLFTKGQQYAYTFAQPGEYPYYCKRHESMRGIVRVVAK